MSAYICHPKTFMGIAAFAVRNVSDHTLQAIADEIQSTTPRTIVSELSQHAKASLVANILREENIRSVQHRYPDVDIDELPGDYALGLIQITAKGLANTRDYPPMIIIKACHCVNYQSCETDDWKDTPACALLQKIEAAAVRRLPGYDDAPWGME